MEKKDVGESPLTSLVFYDVVNFIYKFEQILKLLAP